MSARRFGLLGLFALLAIAGAAGTALESAHHEEDRGSICDCASRPAAKASSIRNRNELQRLVAGRRLVRGSLNKDIVSLACTFPNNPPISRYRVLRI
jgi:hypothetical protein